MGRLLPGKRAAEHSVAHAKAHRQQRIGSGILRQMRPGEAEQDAAPLHPAAERGGLLIGERPDIVQHQHREIAAQQLLDAAATQLREGLERALDVIEPGQDRLGAFGGGAGDEADRAPAPALVPAR